MAGRHNEQQHPLTTQRGAVAVWMAGALMALIAATLLAIDTGRLYYEQRNLQRLASLAAVSAAQTSSGCAARGIPAKLNEVVPVVSALLLANGGSADMLTSINGAGTVELGAINKTTGIKTLRVLPEGDARIDAVRVNLSKARPTSFLLQFLGSDTGGRLYASATAQQAAIGTFYLGTTLVSLDSATSPLLNPILRGLLCSNPASAACSSGINLNAVGYQGLANVNVTAEQLATALGLQVKDLSDPLALQTKTPVLSDFLNGLLGGLGDSVSSGVASTLQGLAVAAQGNPSSVPIADLLGGLVGNISPNLPIIDLMSLITMAGQAAKADPTGNVSPILLPISNLPLLNVAGLSNRIYLQVLESPQIGVGHAGSSEAVARSAQIRLMVRLEASGVVTNVVGVLNSLLSLAGVQVLPKPLNIGVDVTVNPALAQLDTLECPGIGAGASPIAELSAQAGIADVRIGTFTTGAIPLDSTADLPIVTLGGARLLYLRLSSVGVGSTGLNPLPNPVTLFDPVVRTSGDSYNFLAHGIPPDAKVTGNPQTISSGLGIALNVDLRSESSGGLISGLLSGLLNTLLSLVNGALNLVVAVVNGLTSQLIEPLLNLLGIQVGKATVIMQGVSVDQPINVTTCLPGAGGARGCPTFTQ